MAVHPPIVRRFVPPTEEEAAAARAEGMRIRRERQSRREQERPRRREAILVGPELRDVEAAVDCFCSCHPRPIDLGNHDGGVSCHCQLTPEEREANREHWLREWAELTTELAEAERSGEQKRETELAEATVALGVSSQIAVSAAPFVMVGTCDGRGFYLRERHGVYRVTIAPDDDPESDPWSAEPDAPSIDVATGGEQELMADGRFSAAAALRVAVSAVRTALARNSCDHTVVAGGEYCPTCGVLLSEAARWRWT